MPGRNPKTIEEARAQAAEHYGFAAGSLIQVGDEVFEIPNPAMLSDESAGTLRTSCRPISPSAIAKTSRCRK